MPRGKKPETTVAAETVTEETTAADSTPAVAAPKTFQYGSDGLVIGMTYPKKSNGKIDWRQLIDPQYLDFKTDKKDEIERVYGKKLEELVPNDVDEKYLTMTLNGARELAKLRGAISVNFVNVVAMPGFVSADCVIEWIANTESPNGIGETYSDGADATLDNTFDFYARYLTTAAYNRAFIRCVRNFLGIYIVGKDEMGPDDKGAPIAPNQDGGVDGVGPHAMLADLLKRRGNRTVPQMIKFLKTKGYEKEGMDEWKEVGDIPKVHVFEIVGLVNKKD